MAVIRSSQTSGKTRRTFLMKMMMKMVPFSTETMTVWRKKVSVSILTLNMAINS